MWRALYLRRWRCEEDKGASSAAGKSIPLGFDSWRAAFKFKDLDEVSQRRVIFPGFLNWRYIFEQLEVV